MSSRAAFKRRGSTSGGSLTVMMLDTKGTFDELVSALRVLARSARSHPAQHALPLHLDVARGHRRIHGDGELYALRSDPRWDVIVIDTPPTTNALDFLDAPERMIEALDSPVFRWLVSAFESTGPPASSA